MVITKIKKRDGRMVPFNTEKIASAIFKAAKASGGDDYGTALDLASRVVDYIYDTYRGETPSVEQVQDAVEKILVETGHAKTAKEYILYRAERTRVREMNTRLMKVYEDLTFKSSADNEVKRENANIDGDTAMGTMLKYGSEGSKQFYQMFVLDPRHAKAHQSGDIHIHDLDFLTLTTTCCQIDVEKLFENGFSTGHGHLREPNDVQSYSALACIAIQANQNDQHGGQSIPNFDYGMAKGVAKTYKRHYRANIVKSTELLSEQVNVQEKLKSIFTELEYNGILPVLADDNDYAAQEYAKLSGWLGEDTTRRVQAAARKYAQAETRRSTYQAMEALIHNLNTMNSRAGAQVPFSSINYGMDTSAEGRMVIEQVLLATEAGLGNGETPIFPIQIFKIKEGVNYNPEDPNYDLFKLSCRTSAKRLFPNYSFLDAPFNKQFYIEGDPSTEVAYMGCRTRVIGRVEGEEKPIVNGRGNLSFTSINLPRLAIRAKGDVERFFKMYDENISLCREQLLHRFRIQAAKTVKNYPFLMGQGVWRDSEKLSVNDSVGDILKKYGTLTVGFIGLAECLKALTGKHHGESKESQELGLRIIGHLRQRMDEATAETGFNYSVIATPGEGLSGRFVKIDAEKYGIIQGVTDRDYYTNGFHVPVYYNINAFDKIQIEAPYHEFTNGGHITYVELDGDPTTNLDAFERVVRCMKESGVGYGSINHPVDRDPVCGFTGIINNECPRCGRHEDAHQPQFERIRRITGYLVGTLDRFNDAKRSEVEDRVKHGIGSGFETI